MSASDFSGRLLAPVMTRPRRPLSNSASTASCNIRFSLRMMMSGAQLDQPLQAVVAVDDAAIEIVEIGGGEAPAIERNERPQIRRDHRHLRQDHPFRLVAGLLERLDDLEPLGDLLLLDVGIRARD